MIDGGADGDGDDSRALAPGAPRSPGTVPMALARHLRTGEALIWWDTKNLIEWRPAAIFAGFAALILAVVTVIVPEFWTQPLRDLWKPVAALLSPAALLLARERMNLRSTMVTDNSIVDVARDGSADRLAFKNIRTVKRDLLWGGVKLEGDRHRIRIPPPLMGAARQAIRHQIHGRVQAMDQQPEDPTGWLG